MATLGRACLILALVVAVYGVVAGLAAWRLEPPRPGGLGAPGGLRARRPADGRDA